MAENSGFKMCSDKLGCLSKVAETREGSYISCREGGQSGAL